MKTNFMNGDTVAIRIYSNSQNRYVQDLLFELGFSWTHKRTEFLGLGPNYPVYLILNSNLSSEPMRISWNQENLIYNENMKLDGSYPLVTVLEIEKAKDNI
jgi:hypothetical protein